ncbi:MAG: NAD(P)H-dependent oxidoreductase [Alphaproteobacteria bacterium]|nr:NAD(P)H-dependent oxidoreductase [Alphaproteobacteria bacterium]
MKILIVYYSLSGTTRAVATALAKELAADVEEIRCERYAPGPLGAIKAAIDSWRGRLPAIASLSYAVAGYDLVVVGGPIWAFHAATPVRAFLRREAARLRGVAFLLTHGGSAAERSLRELQQLAGRAPTATLVVREADVKTGTFAAAVSSFAAALRPAKAA